MQENVKLSVDVKQHTMSSEAWKCVRVCDNKYSSRSGVWLVNILYIT